MFGSFSVLFGTRFVLHCHAVFAVREGKLFPWRQQVEAVAEGTFGTFSVLFVGTRFVFHCHAVLLFGKAKVFSHGDKSEKQ